MKKSYYLLTDGHWNWIVYAGGPEGARRLLHDATPDAGSDVKVRKLEDVMKQYNGVIGLEGIEPPYDGEDM